ncbi:MAG TPA: hypothetical protein VK453_05220 [Micromonosporaceae bacterium]|nr:hypothetical protein [Micromonosporaceae bacterium]
MHEEVEYTDDEWGLLVGLPQSIIIAAASAEPNGSRRTHAEHEAGMQAIAEGRESPNPLVARIAGLILERAGDPESGEEAPVIQFTDREAGIADVIRRAKAAGALLGAHAGTGTGAADAEAYKHWLVTIADQVVNAAKSGGILGIGGDWVSDAERRFLDELALVLGD